MDASIATEVDRMIFILIDYYPTVDMIGRKSVAMFISSHRVERTDFVFTRRT